MTPALALAPKLRINQRHHSLRTRLWYTPPARRISGHLGTQGASRHISESSTGRESGSRLTGGVGRSLACL